MKSQSHTVLVKYTISKTQLIRIIDYLIHTYNYYSLFKPTKKVLKKDIQSLFYDEGAYFRLKEEYTYRTNRKKQEAKILYKKYFE